MVPCGWSFWIVVQSTGVDLRFIQFADHNVEAKACHGDAADAKCDDWAEFLVARWSRDLE